MSDFNKNPQPSFFDNHSTQDLYKEIQETYKINDYPWIIGYSGGKDSTATTQIVWYALAELSPEERTKPVYVISSDTLVETPVVVDQINNTLEKIKTNSQDQNLPFQTQKVIPKVADTFWVNLIGKGYPAPTNRFRWCTERMKINPANTFVIETAEKAGEVVMILGARKEESMSRAQVLSKGSRQIAGNRLQRHSSLMRAYVYTPIQEFTTDDVWTYLLQVPSPWGGSNRDLAALYRSSQSGECPLVIDTSTPSCGNSRFGCWVCTVVDTDKSMTAMIDNGEEWMQPLLDYRDMLSETQIPERKLEYRDFKRRNGQVIVRSDGKFIPGPYKPEFRKKILRKLLQTQIEIQKEGPDPDLLLITDSELHEIRRIWRSELSDWEDNVPIIYREETGKDLNWINDDAGVFGTYEKSLLKELAMERNVPLELVTRLIDTERSMQGMGRRSGIYNQIHRLFAEEWGDEDEVLEKSQQHHKMLLELELEDK